MWVGEGGGESALGGGVRRAFLKEEGGDVGCGGGGGWEGLEFAAD